LFWGVPFLIGMKISQTITSQKKEKVADIIDSKIKAA